MKSFGLKFWGLVLLQVILLLFIVIRYQSALSSGTPVLLKVVPVDPRDLLRGDYVTFSYEISNLDLTKITNQGGEYNENDTVYVRLEQGDKFWNASAIDKSFHPTTASEIWLKGRKTSNWRMPDDWNKQHISISYGIEQFFVPEGTGMLGNSRDISVEIVVNKSGFGMIKQVYDKDNPINLKPIK